MTDRAEALRALIDGTPDPAAAPQPVSPALPVRSGRIVHAGGTAVRVALAWFEVSHADGPGQPQTFHRVDQGDLVHLAAAQADRLDGLGFTATEDAYAALFVAHHDDTVSADDTMDDATDDDLAAMTQVELVDWVKAHPAEKSRVRELELDRAKPRAGVLTATQD